MDAEDIPPAPRAKGGRSRFWLFAPFAILVVAALAWSAAWFAIRGRTAEALDAWLANEAVAGRRWDCPDRTVGGFPFRIEIACARLALHSRDLTLSAGRLRTVTQVYQPRHTIAELEGPLAAAGQGITLEGSWAGLRASVHTAKDGLQRASLAVEGPSLKVTGLPIGEVAAAARRSEAHLRPSPALPPAESAFDLATSLSGAAVPMLDRLLGGPEPLDSDLQLTLTQTRLPAVRGPRDALESWREAGGRLLVTRLDLAKGPRRLEAKGELTLDGERRPAGRVELAAAGMGDLLAALTGGRLGGGPGGNAGGLLGGLLQPRSPQAAPGAAPQSADAKPALAPLPPLRLENGRVLVGPFTVPAVRLQPLY